MWAKLAATRWWIGSALVVLIGCGRIGFEHVEGDGGAADDRDARPELVDASGTSADAAAAPDADSDPDAGPGAAVDAAGGGLTCGDGATCQLDCPEGGCSLHCGGDSTCSLDCPGDDCEIICEAGASCTLTCPGCNIQVTTAETTELRCSDNTCTSG